MLRESGLDLNTLTLDALYDVGYSLLMTRATLTKEEHEAMDKLRNKIRQLMVQSETGLPAIAALVPPADGGPLPDAFTQSTNGLWVPGGS